MPETDGNIARLDVSVARLDERLKSLEKKTDDHHEIVLNKIQELKDGLIDRVVKLEMQVTRMEGGKFSSVDFIQFRNNEFIPVSKKVSNLVWWLALFIGGGGTIITLVNWYLLYRHG